MVELFIFSFEWGILKYRIEFYNNLLNKQRQKYNKESIKLEYWEICYIFDNKGLRSLNIIISKYLLF